MDTAISTIRLDQQLILKNPKKSSYICEELMQLF